MARYSLRASNAYRDPWMEHARDVIESTYGVKVSAKQKSKDLLKFGRSNQVQTTDSTIMTLPTGIYQETYVSSNLITSIVSTATGDTETVVIEGHTVDGNGDFTFVVQSATLTGQTAATLSTPLARCTRIYNSDSTLLTGTVSVTEDDTYTTGVPNTPAGVHCQIAAGQQQSEKAGTTISSSDYWVLTGFYADCLEKTSTSVDVDLEIRLKGGVFRQVVDISCSTNHRGDFRFAPYLIVPPNSDVRLVARASAAGKQVSGGIMGVLLK